MTSRRKFIQSGLVFSSVSLPGLATVKTLIAAPHGPELTLENFVSDSRYTESLNAAQNLRTQGVTVVEIDGDVSDLWYFDYSLKWKQTPMTLAGITGSDALFVLETLAVDHGMRLLYKERIGKINAPTAEPPGARDVPLYSWIIAPKMKVDTTT